MTLKDYRNAAGLSQRQLADAANVGIKSLQAYEQGAKDINKAQAATVLRLSRALGCRMEDLIRD